MNEEEQRKNIPTKPLIERLIEKSIAEPEVVVPKTDQELAEEPSLEEETEDFSYLSGKRCICTRGKNFLQFEYI